MKLVTYNTQYGVGRDGRFDLGRIAKEVDGADIIALQEVTRNFAAQRRRRHGGRAGGAAARLFPRLRSGHGPRLRRTDKDGRPLNKRFQFGNMVLSRWPIVASRNLLLPRTLQLQLAATCSAARWRR